MKHIVKALCIIILAVALFALVGFLIGFRINYVTDDGASAKLHYVDAETANALCVELSDPEKMHIIEILDGKFAFPDSPSCPFQYEISFEIGGKRYLPSLDDCRLIQIDNTGKYIKISEAEKSLLLSILEKYAQRSKRLPVTSGVLVHNSCNHGSEWNSERNRYWKNTSKVVEEDKNYGAYIVAQNGGAL